MRPHLDPAHDRLGKRPRHLGAQPVIAHRLGDLGWLPTLCVSARTPSHPKLADRHCGPTKPPARASVTS